ncbi:MAG: hypothetical protein AABY38_00915, partial [Planctomycetota bacterium]
VISDRMEMNLPEARGFLTVQDIETDTIKSLDISTTLKKTKPYLALLRKLNIDHLALSTEEDEEICVKKISEFFDRRIRRGGRRRR